MSSHPDAEAPRSVTERYAGLDDVRSLRQVYRQIACEATPKLPPTPFRFLCRLLDMADRDLDNCFPRLETLAGAMHVSRAVAAWNVGQLVKLGWIRRYEFHREDGRQSSSGVQFCIPEDTFGEHLAWEGPAGFAKHGKHRRKTRRKDA